MCNSSNDIPQQPNATIQLWRTAHTGQIFNPSLHLDELLLFSTEHDCPNVFFQPNEPVWIDTPAGKFPLTEHPLTTEQVEEILLKMTKTPAALGILESDRIDLAYQITRKEQTPDGKGVKRRYRYRFNAVGVVGVNTTSYTLSIRKIDAVPPYAAKLGLEPELVDFVTHCTRGLMIIAGATGQGKTTTLAALIRELLSVPGSNQHLVTIESPVEYIYSVVPRSHALVSQIPIGVTLRTFKVAIENCMRMAPTTILVGETRDEPTAESCLDASNTGHFVMTSLHANDVHTCVERFVDLFPPNQQHKARVNLINEIRGVVAQRLIPTNDGKKMAIRSQLIFTDQIRHWLYENVDNLTLATKEAVQKWGRPMVQSIEEAYSNNRITQVTYQQLLREYA